MLEHCPICRGCGQVVPAKYAKELREKVLKWVGLYKLLRDRLERLKLPEATQAIEEAEELAKLVMTGVDRRPEPCVCGSTDWNSGGPLGAHCCRCDRDLVLP